MAMALVKPSSMSLFQRTSLDSLLFSVLNRRHRLPLPNSDPSIGRMTNLPRNMHIAFSIFARRLRKRTPNPISCSPTQSCIAVERPELSQRRVSFRRESSKVAVKRHWVPVSIGYHVESLGTGVAKSCHCCCATPLSENEKSSGASHRCSICCSLFPRKIMKSLTSEEMHWRNGRPTSPISNRDRI